jgi:CheY-like chemotaxis protein
VGALLATMRSLLKRTLGERIRVEMSECPPVSRCVADCAQLESVLLNLAINARDAMPEGGTLAIHVSDFTIDETQLAEHPNAPAGSYVLLLVRDTGVGIPAETLSRVFDPFFTTKGVGAGTGLGLSMAYGFAKQSGGHIEIDSAVGVGTQVRLYLPMTDLPAREFEDAENADIPEGQGESVLVVEDEPAVRRFVVTLLEGLGYVVLAVADGEEALAVLNEMETVDLLLSDVVLPGAFSGPRLAKELGRRRPQLKVLLMSGYADDVLSSERSRWPSEALLHKPVRKIDLARKIRAALDA